MAYATYKDRFKSAVTTGGADFVYTITGTGSISTENPVSHAQERDLGSVFRYKDNEVTVEFESTNATTTTDTYLMPNVVGILGHNLVNSGSSQIQVTWHFRTGSPYSQTRIITSSLNNAENKEGNNAYFVNRQRHDDIPYKVVIYMFNDDNPGDIDIGRIWVGSLWDLATPGGINEAVIQNGWALGYTGGAESILTRGQQSFTDNEQPRKKLGFALKTTDEEVFLGDLLLPLDESNSLLGFVKHLRMGGACIVVPRDTNDITSTQNLDKIFVNRAGIYGESLNKEILISHGDGTQYEASFSLVELL